MAEYALGWLADEEEDPSKPACGRIDVRKNRYKDGDDCTAPVERDAEGRQDKEIKRFGEGNVSGRGRGDSAATEKE